MNNNGYKSGEKRCFVLVSNYSFNATDFAHTHK